MTWIEEQIKSYHDFLIDNTIVKEIKDSDWSEIHTPHLGLFNDYITLYVKKDHNQFILSDDAETLSNLEMAGYNLLKHPTRKGQLDAVLRTYGIKSGNRGELSVLADSKSFAQRQFNLISAIIELNSFALLAKSKSGSLFKEDVKTFLEADLGLVVTLEFIGRGESGLEFTFDFLQATRTEERFIKSIPAANSATISHYLFAFEDLASYRTRITGKRQAGIAILDDKNGTVDQTLINALTFKRSEYVLWSRRHEPESIALLKAA